MKPDFMDRIAKIIAEVHNRTCIDKIDTEVLEYILQKELIEYHNEAYTYGHTTGYDAGYTDGHESSLGEAVERAYYEGYDDGLNEAVATEGAAYYEGYDEGRSEVDHE